jgi:DNA-binding PadR family transcriptional regulator
MLTTTSYLMLAVFARCGEMTSYELKGRLAGAIGSFWPVPHTTAYQEPARLRSAGYLVARVEEGGRRRRRYAITEAGREALEAWIHDPVAAPPEFHDELMVKIFAGANAETLVGERIAWCDERIAVLESGKDEESCSDNSTATRWIHRAAIAHAVSLRQLDHPG